MFENDSTSHYLSALFTWLKNPIFIIKIMLVAGGLMAICAGLWLELGGPNSALAVQNCPMVSPLPGDFSQDEEILERLSVDIGGAVEKPGLYELEKGSRYADILALSGGPSKDVSKEFMAKQLNLSKELKDQEKIYVPFASEMVVTNNDIRSDQQTDQSNTISVNTASSENLQTLKGVGEATAQKIISGRPYSELMQLVSNKILSEKLFSDLESQLKL